MSGKITGGFVNYYLAPVTHPQRKEQPAYVAECEDIAEALQLTPNEFCEFKAIWRTAAARLGNGKPDHKSLYDAEKRLHYAGRDVAKYKRELEEEGEVDLAKGVWLQHTQRFVPQGLTPKMRVVVQFLDGSTMGPKPVEYFDWVGRNDSDRNIDRFMVCVAAYQDAPAARTDGWFDHTGRNMPGWLDPSQEVMVMLADGTMGSTTRPAKDWAWERDDMPTAIVTYRPVQHLS